jgi:hypothetical protein
MNPEIKKLYTKEELQKKLKERITKCEWYQKTKDYRLLAAKYYEIANLYEILGSKEKKEYYYQKIVDVWNTHPEEIHVLSCAAALKKLNRPEEAFNVVLKYSKNSTVTTLANLYREVGREDEARLLFSSEAYHRLELAKAYYKFWRPHYLQDAADFFEKGGQTECALKYNQQAREAWEERKDNIPGHFYPVEKGWLYEEVGYIYERAGKCETALKYYRKAKSQYELAYSEEHLASTEAVQAEWNWDRYKTHFALQISDFELIYFRSDDPQENDYRRIRFRILNLKEQIKS